MALDLHFALILAVRMVITAGFVLSATLIAERAGPLVGGLVAALPLGAGPVYVFLAMDHDVAFIADSAVNSLAINFVNVSFALIYALLAQRRPLYVAQPLALAAWVAMAWSIYQVPWTAGWAFAANVVIVGACVVLARPLRHVAIPRVPIFWTDLVMRACMVAALVGVTVSASFYIGPGGSGILAVFPIILISVQIILHRRVGGKASAAVMANAILGLVGFGFACLVLHFTAVPLGVVVGLSLALATSVGWGLMVLAARRYGIAV